MRILGIDYGDRRIGIAISDPMGITAGGIETIEWDVDMIKPVQRIKKIVEEYNVNKIVTGIPRNMNGTFGPRAEKTIEFISLMEGIIPDIEIVKWDERLTTMAANRTMHELGIKKSKKKKIVDQIAAVYILQGYLNNIKNNASGGINHEL